MPKIVENVKERILLETRKQIEEFGYSKVNIRGIAAACNIGVGTIYNYFESKDVIIANFMLSDWFLCIQKIKDKIAGGENSIEMAYVYFSEFTASHSYLFSDDIAYKNYKVNLRIISSLPSAVVIRRLVPTVGRTVIVTLSWEKSTFLKDTDLKT